MRYLFLLLVVGCQSVRPVNPQDSWLTQAGQVLECRIEDHTGQPMPAYAVAAKVGWDDRIAGWTSPDGTEVYISPDLEDMVVVATLLHELVHVWLIQKHGFYGHDDMFEALAQDVGLTGPMTATYPTTDLRVELEMLLDNLGPFPRTPLAAQECPD